VRPPSSARMQLMLSRRCYTFWVGTSLLLLGALHLVDLKTLPSFCASCRGERGCGYTKDASATADFDLMHTHMCSLGLYCMRAAGRCSCASGASCGVAARAHARVMENAALCLAVEAAAVADDDRSLDV
jgi:prenyltransferase beta subunit